MYSLFKRIKGKIKKNEFLKYDIEKKILRFTIRKLKKLLQIKSKNK